VRGGPVPGRPGWLVLDATQVDAHATVGKAPQSTPYRTASRGRVAVNDPVNVLPCWDRSSLPPDLSDVRHLNL